MQGYDAAGNATIRRAIFSGSEQVEVSQYNLRGQLEYVFQPVAIGSSVGGGVKESRVYDLVGRLVKREEYFAANSVRKIGTTSWNGSTVVSNNTVSIAGWVKHTDNMFYDKDGRTTYQNSYGRKVDWFVESSYVGNGASLASLAQSGDWLSALSYNRSYDAAGRMMGYKYEVVKNEEGSGATSTTPSGYTHSYAITYQLRGSYLENTNSGWSSSTLFKASTTTSQYDAWGRRVAIREQTPNQSSIKDRVRYFSYDGEGGILRRREGTLNSSGNWWQTAAETLRDTFYTYGNGQQVARQTKDGEFSVAGGPSIEDSVASNPMAMSHGGSGLRGAILASMAGRNYGISARDAALLSEKAKQNSEQNKLIRKGTLDAPGPMQVWAGYGGKGAGMSKVQVQPGETLQTLAQRVYGNSSMWYLLAEANGLASNEALVGGTQISVPDVQTSKNDSTTFKPYNPSEAIGPTSPTLPYVPPPKGCNMIAMVIIALVAVVATVFTAGAAAAGFGAGFSAIMSTGAALITGGYGLAAAVVFGAIGAVGGSIASQVVGKALGVVDHFSLRAVVAAGITGALTGAISSGMGGSIAQLARAGQWASAAGSAVLNSAAGYIGNKVAGVEGASFSWKSIAASAVTAAISAKVSGSLGLTTDNFGTNLANGIISGVTSMHVRRAFGFDDQVNYGAIAADAFGNALGNAIIEKSVGGNFFGPKNGDPSARENAVQVISRNNARKENGLAVMTPDEERKFLDLAKAEKAMTNYSGRLFKSQEKDAQLGGAYLRALADADPEQSARLMESLIPNYQVQAEKTGSASDTVSLLNGLIDKLGGQPFVIDSGDVDRLMYARSRGEGDHLATGGNIWHPVTVGVNIDELDMLANLLSRTGIDPSSYTQSPQTMLMLVPKGAKLGDIYGTLRTELGSLLVTDDYKNVTNGLVVNEKGVVVNGGVINITSLHEAMGVRFALAVMNHPDVMTAREEYQNASYDITLPAKYETLTTYKDHARWRLNNTIDHVVGDLVGSGAITRKASSASFIGLITTTFYSMGASAVPVEEAVLIGLAKGSQFAKAYLPTLKRIAQGMKVEVKIPFTSDRAFNLIDVFRSKKAGFESLGDYIPVKGDNMGTVALVDLNGTPVFGVNSSALLRDADKDLARKWRDQLGLGRGKDQVFFHGEAHSLMRAYEKSGGDLPSDLTMYVDRLSCGNCQTYLPRLAKAMNIDTLTLTFKDGRSAIIKNGKFIGDWK